MKTTPNELDQTSTETLCWALYDGCKSVREVATMVACRPTVVRAWLAALTRQGLMVDMGEDCYSLSPVGYTILR